LLLLSSVNLGSIFLISGKINITTGSHVANLLLGDRPYVGCTYVVSFSLCFYLASSVPKAKYLFYALACVFPVFLLIISARISLVSIGIIVLASFFYTKNVRKLRLVVIGFLFFCILMFSLNQNLRKRFFISENNYSWEQLVRFEPRYYIWNCVYCVFDSGEDHVFGEGFVNTNNRLKNCYVNSKDFMNQNQQDFFVRKEFNSHNQFFNFILSTGGLSSILFVSFFLFWIKDIYGNQYSVSLLLTIFLFCSVENVLSRQIGVELFSLTVVFSNMMNIKNQE